MFDRVTLWFGCLFAASFEFSRCLDLCSCLLFLVSSVAIAFVYYRFTVFGVFFKYDVLSLTR